MAKKRKTVGLTIDESSTQESVDNQIEETTSEEAVLTDNVEIPVDEPVVCDENCECHNEKEEKDFELMADGIYIKGELCTNPTKLYNFFHSKIEEMFDSKIEE
jgi:hypothetical protein